MSSARKINMRQKSQGQIKEENFSVRKESKCKLQMSGRLSGRNLKKQNLSFGAGEVPPLPLGKHKTPVPETPPILFNTGKVDNNATSFYRTNKNNDSLTQRSNHILNRFT